MLRSFIADRSGQYGLLMGILAIPMVLTVGLSVDYTRHSSAHSRLQQLADGTALVMAASRETDAEKLLALGQTFLQTNMGTSSIKAVEVEGVSADDNKIDLRLKSSIPAYFMGLAGINTLKVRASALAERAVTGSVEVALVLDNTWSMSEKDEKGVTKIATLKVASKSLATELLSNKDASVKIGVVPYADYVNVGTQYRNEPWLSVPADSQTTPAPKVCVTKTEKSRCDESLPTYSCTKVIDGVSEPDTCGGGCAPGKTVTYTVAPYESCTGGGNPVKSTWYGCVGSRMTGTTRLDDGSPAVKYPGYVESSQKCLNALLPLSTDKAKVLKALDDMIINIGSYKPYTYIPAGLIWGQNLLSKTAPFTEATDYDLLNKEPRKVVVLMTDGDNTLQFTASTGRHSALSTTAATAKTQVTKTNADTASICAYMKTKKIEIYTVAFMVDNDDAKTLLEGCATDKDHYYDASDPVKLVAAFSGIAKSLSQVRLAR